MSYQPGETYQGFLLERREPVAEIRSEALLFRHVQTQAQLAVFLNDDDNKVFLIGFRTPPADDTGLPHILEHSVLNGSRKYPVKEPFAELLKASLYTFLNAFTYPDKTVYPVASRNRQDFRNLVDVYLDAVFFPNISRHTFMQEGWHYELASVDGELQYSGVVYNEMLGAYSNPESLLSDELHKTIFPDSIYGRDSGGAPNAIPSLTYEQFREFHRRYYHPSNSRLVLYGDLDLDEQLGQLAEYLVRFTREDLDTRIQPQPRRRLQAQRRVPYPISVGESTDHKTFLIHAWLLEVPPRANELLAWEVLSRILVGTPAAPLRKALTDAHLGEDVLAWGFDSGILDHYFAIGLRGTDADKLDAMKKVLRDTLRQLARQGLDPKMIEASLNSTEFHLREANFGGYPQGLVHALETFNSWLYDEDPLVLLRYEAPLAELRRRLAAGPYFETLIERELLACPHQATVILEPDPQLEEKRLAELRDRLARVKAGMSPAQLEQLVAQARELKEAQEQPDSPEALAAIPKLPLSCIDRRAEVLHFEDVAGAGCRLSFSRQPTNGILYLRLSFDAAGVPLELLPAVPVFGRLTLQCGTQARDYVDLTQEIDLHSGGIASHYGVLCALDAPNDIRSGFSYSAKALCAKVPRLFDLLAEIVGGADLRNRTRIEELLTIAKSGMQSRIVPNGHSFASSRLAAYHSRLGRYDEVTGGLDQFYFLEHLVERFADEPDSVLASFEKLRRILFRRGTLYVHVTGGDEELAAVRAALPTLLAAIPEGELQPATLDFPALVPNEGFIVPSKIQYVGLGGNLYDLGFRYHGSFEVLNKYLSRDYLWNQVRVRGGAYGCFSSFDQLSGNFAMVSYRDPRLAETLEVYQRFPRHLAKLRLGKDEFDKLLIGTMGSIDRPLTPDQKGALAMRRRIAGVTPDEVQKRREEVLACTRKQLKEYAGIFAQLCESPRVCVLGGEELIRRHQDRFARIQSVFTR